MSIKYKLKQALSQETCTNHPIAVVIENYGNYVLGYNGAPTRGISHEECSRKGFASGQGIELCPTVHAEIKAISHAARQGIFLDKGIIYMSEWFPCDNCAKAIIEAGLEMLVTPDEIYQDKTNHILIPKLQNQPYNFEMAERLIRQAGIEIIIDPSIKP